MEQIKDRYQDAKRIERLLKDFKVKLTPAEFNSMLKMDEFKRDRFRERKIEQALMA